MGRTANDVRRRKDDVDPGLRRTVSVASLFDRAQDKSKKHKKNDAEITNVGTLFNLHKPTGTTTNDPHFRQFLATVDDYRNNAGSETDKLEVVHDKLVARLDGLDVDGRPLDTPGIPTRQDFKKLNTMSIEMSKPLAQETFQVAMPQADGTMANKESTLGQTMLAFDRLVGRQRKKLAQLNEQLKTVKKEIAAAVDDIRHDRDGQVAAVRTSLQVETDKLKAQIEDEKALALREIKDAQKEEKRHMAEKSKRLEEFMKQW